MNLGKLFSKIGQLPSIVLVFVFIGAIAAFIGGIILIFWALATVEGVASIIMLLVAWGVIRLMTSAAPVRGAKNVKDSMGGKANIAVAMGIAFFALMGIAVDQTGNYLYNQPLAWLFCPDKTELHRGVDVTHPLPGQTNITQDFNCLNSDNQVIESIGMGEVIGVRFVEYVLIGYGLIWLNRLYNRLRRRRKEAVSSPGESLTT